MSSKSGQHDQSDKNRVAGDVVHAPARFPQEVGTPEPFVDSVKAAEFLSLRPRRVMELAREGIIPAYPLGRGERKIWRFRLSEVAFALRVSRVDCARQSPAPIEETI
jgi:hypothetical protein